MGSLGFEMRGLFFPIGIAISAAALGWSGRALAGDCQVTDYGAMPVDMQGARATTVVKINGQDTRFILDTGASWSVMSRANADALKLRRDLLPGGHLSGLGGDTRAELATVSSLGILGTSIRDVQFLVGGSDTGLGIIGANLLDLADLDIDLAQGKLHLMTSSGCGKRAFAYWAQDGNYQVADLLGWTSRDRRSFVTVELNGKRMRALLDTGAPYTLVSRRAAEHAGIDLASPQAKASYTTHGVGTRNYKSWTVNVDSLSVGTESIAHSQVQVLDGDLGENGEAPEMLLGVDFFLAHHLYISNTQEKLYLTYNGGRVFSLAKAPKGTDAPEPPSPDDPNAPKTAEDYALRGQAHLSRGEPAAAVADLDNAIRMAPDAAAYYSARARAQLALNQPDAALADLDQSINLNGADAETLLLRARQRQQHHDTAGAQADVDAARRLASSGSAQSRAIARFYISVDQPAQAVPLLDDWIRLHSDDAELGAALNERCRARGLANQMLDSALSDCKNAIRRDGALPGYLDNLALVQLRLKKYPDAIETYEQVVAKLPGSAWARYALGLAKVRGGQADAGRADLEAAKALDPKIEERFTLFGV